MNGIHRNLDQPIRLSMMIFGGLALLVLATSLVVSVSRLSYLLVGLPYSMLLSVLSVGIALVSRRVRKYLLLGLVVLVAALTAIAVFLCVGEPENPQWIITLAAPLLAALGAWLVAVGIAAAYGWATFLRTKGNRQKTE